MRETFCALIALAAVLLGASVVLATDAPPVEPPKPIDGDHPSPPKPIVVALFTDGKEAVITPDPAKMKAAGVTMEMLEVLRYRRLSEGKWTVKIDDREIILATFAEITVRDIVVKPFIVTLLDGREALITPDARKVAEYLITGEAFEADVRRHLADPLVDIGDVGQIVVLRHILVPGGQVPNVFDERHVHHSLGEPLEKFAKVELRGRPGPQLADLQYMRKVHRHLDGAAQLARGMTRADIEKRFGTGRHLKDQHDRETNDVEYVLGPGSLFVDYDSGFQTAAHMSAYVEASPTIEPSSEVGQQARARGDAERGFILAFLKRIAEAVSNQQRTALLAFLDKTQEDLGWTDVERSEILGGK